MDSKKLLEKVNNGVVCALAEYRSTRTDTIKWNDKTTQARKSAEIVEHTVEIAGRSATVTHDVPEGSTLADVKAPFPKGTMCLVVVEQMQVQKGRISIRGRLEALEANGK